MNDKVFIDTNILIYSIDDSDILKQQRAKNAIIKISHNAIISTQVLQEFYNIATKKLGISKENARLLVDHLSKSFKVHQNTVSDIIKAIDISIKTGFSFWDSLIISAALSERCSILYSEDLSDNQHIDELLIKNPF
ncbi:MAG: PIN domain-containing protein [Spirochaetaceae bacterium]|nr:PIN domain-containing protein [Spirochaetaceae bacterium]